MEILREAGCDWVGVDISSVAVNAARKKGFLAFRCKLPELPRNLGGNGFDVCTIVETLEHVSNFHKTLSNISNDLKKRSRSIVGRGAICRKILGSRYDRAANKVTVPWR